MPVQWNSIAKQGNVEEQDKEVLNSLSLYWATRCRTVFLERRAAAPWPETCVCRAILRLLAPDGKADDSSKTAPAQPAMEEIDGRTEQ